MFDTLSKKKVNYILSSNIVYETRNETIERYVIEERILFIICLQFLVIFKAP